MKALSIIQRNRSYIGFTVVLFITGLLLGLSFSEALDNILQSQIEHIKNLAAKAEGNPAKLASVIFVNNLKVSMLLIVTGIALSVFPIVMIMGNGMAIGYLFASFGDMGQVPIWAIIVFGIVPHGIFEIPAFILAGAMGIKLGYMWLRPLAGESRWSSFLYAGKESLRVLPFILVWLVIAASIEGFVTPELLRWYIG
jgi:stage II sporulation protein M